MFHRIALAALAAGLIAGVVVTAVQAVGTTGIILEAETYENAGEPAAASTEGADSASVAHEHGEDEWAPGDGLERFVFTAGANLVTGVGFAFLLVAAFALKGGPIDWRRGLLWGAAGFVVFQLLPSIGLPPEVPGTEAAALPDRQAWWLLTVAAGAGGLALAVFARPWWLKLGGAVLLVLPHLIGAPEPEHHGGLAPEELAEAFVVVSLATAAVFWLVLGGVAGYLFGRSAGHGAAAA
jgi:cobalt transporter subunit CbtA